MQHLTIIKKGYAPSVNHLYEHLFCIALGRRLREKGFYNYTDYRIEARNYHVGFIYVTALFYNRDILNRIDLTNISPSFSRDDLELARTQINAENDVRIKYNEQEVIAALQELHAQPWENLDSSEVYNWRHTKVHNQPGLSISSVSAGNFRNMVCKIALDQQYALRNEIALPLFHELSQAILYNLSDIFTDVHGYFGSDTDSRYSFTTTVEFHTFRIHRDHALPTKGLLDIIHEYVPELHGDSFKKSFHNYIGTITNVRNYLYDNANIFEATGVLLGSKGWNKALADYSIKEILQNSSIIIRAGGDTDTIRL